MFSKKAGSDLTQTLFNAALSALQRRVRSSVLLYRSALQHCLRAAVHQAELARRLEKAGISLKGAPKVWHSVARLLH
jgi:hypothetical protein